MSSAYLLMTILGIWALLVIPVWVKDRSSSSDKPIQHFKNTMDKLSPDQLLPTREIGPQVTSRRAPKAGHVQALRKRVLIQRRFTFLGSVLTLPLAVIAQLLWDAAPTIWSMPPMALLAHIIFVNYTRRKVDRAVNGVQQINSATTTADSVSENLQPRRSSLAAGLAAVQRTAWRRLATPEPELATSETASWQPAESGIGLGAPWTAPEEVLPTYVTAPAATSVPRQIDRVYGEWNAEAMIKAARDQKSSDLAELVALAQAETELEIVSVTTEQATDNPTIELPKIIGA